MIFNLNSFLATTNFQSDPDESSLILNCECTFSCTFVILKILPMLTKEKLVKTINRLPDSFTIDELIDQLIFVEKVEEGIQQSDEGKTLPNDEVKKMIEEWSK